MSVELSVTLNTEPTPGIVSTREKSLLNCSTPVVYTVSDTVHAFVVESSLDESEWMLTFSEETSFVMSRINPTRSNAFICNLDA